MITNKIIETAVNKFVAQKAAVYKAALRSEAYVSARKTAEVEFRAENVAIGHQDANYSARMGQESHRYACRVVGITYKFEAVEVFREGLWDLFPSYVADAYMEGNLLDPSVQRRWAAEN